MTRNENNTARCVMCRTLLLIFFFNHQLCSQISTLEIIITYINYCDTVNTITALWSCYFVIKIWHKLRFYSTQTLATSSCIIKRIQRVKTWYIKYTMKSHTHYIQCSCNNLADWNLPCYVVIGFSSEPNVAH